MEKSRFMNIDAHSLKAGVPATTNHPLKPGTEKPKNRKSSAQPLLSVGGERSVINLERRAHFFGARDESKT